VQPVKYHGGGKGNRTAEMSTSTILSYLVHFFDIKTTMIFLVKILFFLNPIMFTGAVGKQPMRGLLLAE